MKGPRRLVTQEDEKLYSRKMGINNNHENEGNTKEPTHQMERLEAKLREIKSLIKFMMTVAKTQPNMKNEVKNNLPVLEKLVEDIEFDCKQFTRRQKKKSSKRTTHQKTPTRGISSISAHTPVISTGEKENSI